MVMRTLTTLPARLAVPPPPGTKATIAATARISTTLRRVSMRITRRVRQPTACHQARRAGPSGDAQLAGVARCGDPRLRLVDQSSDGGQLGGHLGLGHEAVPHPEMGVDVRPARRRLLELLAELADEDVDRAVATSHRVAPHPLVDLLALEHTAFGGRQ